MVNGLGLVSDVAMRHKSRGKACSVALAVVLSFVGPSGTVAQPTPGSVQAVPGLTQPGTVVVVANGVGTTVESAVQNAAENALTQVVGSFVDTEKMIDRRSQIANGIREESRNVSSKMREYSQGSIRSFDVIGTQQDAGVVRVTAKVAVQVENFRARMQQALEGSTSVSKGLLAQAATEQRQEANAEAIFVDRVVTPLVQGVGLTLTVGQLERMDASQIPCRRSITPPARDNTQLPACSGEVEDFLKAADQIYRLPITLKADPGVSDAIWQAGASVSRAPCVRLDLRDHPKWTNPLENWTSALTTPLDAIRRQLGDWQPMPERSDYRYVAIMRRIGESSFAEGCYQVLRATSDFDSALVKFTRITYTVSILDRYGEAVEQYLFRPYERSSLYQRNALSPAEPIALDFRRAVLREDGFDNVGHIFNVPHIFATPRSYTFNLLMHMPITVIEKAERITVKINNE